MLDRKHTGQVQNPKVKKAFKDFAEYQLDYDVSFKSNWTDSGKMFLLCNVVSRIPEDVERELKVFDINGKQKFMLIIL